MSIERANDTLTYLNEAGERLGAPLVVATFPSALLTDTDDGVPRRRSGLPSVGRQTPSDTWPLERTIFNCPAPARAATLLCGKKGHE